MARTDIYGLWPHKKDKSDEMDECVFCKIAAGEIPTLKVYDDASVIAFLDINPCSPGHAVVAPRRHYKLLTDMPPEAVKDLFAAVVLVERAVKTAMNAPAANVGVNDGELAGQGLPHVHVHIIPRYKDDKGGSMHSIVRVPVQKEALEGYLNKIRAEIKAGGGTIVGAALAPEKEKEKKEKGASGPSTTAKPKKKWHFLEE